MQNLFAFVLLVMLAWIDGPAFSADANRATAKPDPDVSAIREQSHRFEQALPQAGRWLLEHPDPRHRAAGLLYHVKAIRGLEAQIASAASITTDDRFGNHDSIRQGAIDTLTRAEARESDLQTIEPADLLDRFEHAIRTTTDGAALAWLATACAIADIKTFCVDAGLDDAIVRRDGANLFSRGTLLNDPAFEGYDQLILEAHETKTYFNVHLNTWFDALAAAEAGSRLDDHVRLIGAFSVATASIPAYNSLAQACGADVAAGSELEIACERVLDDMAEHGETALAKVMSNGVRASRAEARGEDQRAAGFEAKNQQIHQRLACAASEIDALLEDDNGVHVRNYVELFLEHGEIEGRKRFAESHGIECSDPA